jgi:glycosyltransferase involved in cell wall biosynthesis
MLLTPRMAIQRQGRLPLRVAHFIQRYPPALGGSEAYFARLSRYLVDAGDQVTVFTSNAFSLEAFWSPRGRCLPAGATVEDGVRVRRYRLWRFPGRRWLLKPLSLIPQRAWQALTLPCNPICFGMWRDAGRLNQRFDAVHAAALPYSFPILCARRLARRLRIPFLVTPFLHLGDPDDPRDPTRRAYTTPAFRALLRSADIVFAQTETERAEMLRMGLPPEKVILQGLGVAPAECTGGDREAVRRAWQVQPGEIVIGHLANNSHEKGTVDLVRAVQLLHRRGLPVRLILAGPEMPSFQRFMADLECGAFPPLLFSSRDEKPNEKPNEKPKRRKRDALHARPLRLGTLTDEQKKDFFAGLDVFALPSRSDSFGLVLLEAWANGVPNVAYRAGGIADVIRHERDGLLVPCGNINGLADALDVLIRDAGLRQHLGQAGRQRLPRDFRWQEKLDLVRQACVQAQKASPRASGIRIRMTLSDRSARQGADIPQKLEDLVGERQQEPEG